MAELILNDGQKLFYQQSGLETGQPMILLHGFSGRHTEFTGQVAPFTAAGFRIIQVDLRNHGRSSYDVGATIPRLSTDIAELIAYLGLTDVIFIAHSMGSAVVWNYCQLFGTDKIAKIVTIDESPQCLSENEWAYGLFETTWATIPDVAGHFSETKMTVQRLPDTTYQAIKSEQATYPFNILANQGLLMNHVSLAWQTVIDRIPVPQLFIAGSDSPLWSSEHATYCASHTALGQAVVIPHTGHLPHAENPEQFNAAVLAFVSLNK